MSKFIFTFLIAATFSCSASAQLAPGSTAPNWTHTDINGNSWDLYSLTAQGKTVILHMAVTWCSPDYSYHMTNNLRNLYDQYGPNGTIDSGEVMVFMIESDPTTTLADLNGTGTNTIGDWVTGTTFPIIDLGPASVAFNTAYDVTFWPMIYKICPDNKIYEVGQPTTPVLISLIGNCSFATDAYPSTNFSPVMCAAPFAPSFILHNNGSNTLTSCDATYSYDGGPATVYNWSGSLLQGQTATVILPLMTFTPGSHTMVVNTSNPNGGTDNNNTNNLGQFVFNLQNAGGQPTPYTNDFSFPTFPYTNWIINNTDGPVTWQRQSNNGGSLYLRYYIDPSFGTLDEVVIEPIDLSAQSTASLQFDLAYRQYSSLNPDSLEVLISADCGLTWNSEWMKSGTSLSTVPGFQTSEFTPVAGQWRSECIDLTAYAGQSKVFIMFRGYGWNGNNIFVDNINVSSTICPTAIAETGEGNNSMLLYPNPASATTQLSFNLSVEAEVTVNIYNVYGELVYSEFRGEMKGEQFLSITTESFANGNYMVELITGEIRTVSRMNVSH